MQSAAKVKRHLSDVLQVIVERHLLQVFSGKKCSGVYHQRSLRHFKGRVLPSCRIGIEDVVRLVIQHVVIHNVIGVAVLHGQGLQTPAAEKRQCANVLQRCRHIKGLHGHTAIKRIRTQLRHMRRNGNLLQRRAVIEQLVADGFQRTRQRDLFQRGAVAKRHASDLCHIVPKLQIFQ